MVDFNKILPIVLIILVTISAVQAVQLNSLKEKLSEGKLSVSSGAKSPVTVSTGNAVASSGSGGAGATGIASLPSMVGGC